MKKKILLLLSIISYVGVSSQNTITWSDTLLNNQEASTQQVTDWNTFRSLLLQNYCYTKMVISGTYDPVGIECTDPVIVQAYANALYTYTPYTSPLTNGHVWSLCNRYLGEVWIDPPNECSGANCPDPGYIIRPGIGTGNQNWGGVNTATCYGPNQRMTLTFYYSTGVLPSAPSQIYGSNSGCIGDTIVLAIDSVYGGANYTWSNTGSSQIITGSNDTTIQLVPGLGTDTIKVIAINNCTGSSAPTVLVFTGNPDPTVTLVTTSTCDNLSSVALNSGSPAGGTYTGANISANNFDAVTSGTGTFPYTYTYTDMNGCTNEDSDSIIVNTAPVATFTYTDLDTVCINYTPITLSGGAPAGGVYSGNGVSAGIFDPSVAGAGTQTIMYTYTAGNNCEGSAIATITVLGCMSIEELNDGRNVVVYPNPFDYVTTIDISGEYIHHGHYTLVDISGKTVLQSNFNGNKIVLNRGNLSPGIYQLTINENNKMIMTGKLMIE